MAERGHEAEGERRSGMKHYLLIKGSGRSRTGAPLNSSEAADALLWSRMWPLWEHTRCRKMIEPGDRVAIYCSGGAAAVIGTARVTGLEPWTRQHLLAYPLLLEGVPHIVLRLDDIRRFDDPLKVQPILTRLTWFARKAPTKKWGVHFMGGVRFVNEADFETFTGKTKGAAA